MPSIPAPLKIRDYRAFWVARFFATVAGMMMVVVIGWQVYDIARESMSRDDAAFLLGMIGLAQFLPLFCLALVVGVIADRVDRRYIARAAVALEICCAGVLGWLALAGDMPMLALFVVAALLGVGGLLVNGRLVVRRVETVGDLVLDDRQAILVGLLMQRPVLRAPGARSSFLALAGPFF